LARRIVEEHGGKITAANDPAGGARMEILLPVEA
jgi:signal transduction histidine kinase